MVEQEAVMAIVLMLFVVIAVMTIYASRYKKVPPDKAMVVYGRRMGPGPGVGYQVLSGGGKFILPVIESYEFLPLDVRILHIDLEDVRISPEGATPQRVRLKATALVKISSEPSVLKVAAEHLMHKADEEINTIAQSTIEGCLRTIFRTSTYEELDVDRNAWATRIQMTAAQDLLNVGLEVRAFNIHDIDLRGQ